MKKIQIDVLDFAKLIAQVKMMNLRCWTMQTKAGATLR